LHHVDQPSGAAEADAQLPLQVRDRDLAAADNDACGLVVEIVLLELQTVRGRLFVFRRDRIVEDWLALFAEKTRQSRALLLRDVRAMEPDALRRSRWQKQHVALAQQLFGAIAVENRARVDFR